MALDWVKPRFDREKFKNVVREADEYLSKRDKVREEAIKLSRDVLKLSGWAVTAIHKGSLEEALGYLREAEEKARRLVEMLSPYPELLNSGMANNALSEYVEARVFIDLITGRGLPGPSELGVGYVPYLQGVGDVVGELRRLALELVRHGEFGRAWLLLDAMEAIYLELRTLDYPEALAPGIRHKADVARRLVDDTKAMLVDLESRRRLEEKLNSTAQRLG